MELLTAKVLGIWEGVGDLVSQIQADAKRWYLENMYTKFGTRY
jgi:hypothetical protein